MPLPVQVVTWTATKSGLMTLTLIFWPWNWCTRGTDNVRANFGAPATFSVELRTNTRRTDDVTLKHRSLTFDVTAHVGDAGHRTPSLYQVWSSPVIPFDRYGTFSVSALIVPVSLTFEISLIFRSVNGSRVICVMCFLPANFQLATPFHSRLRVRHGQTDRRQPSTLNAFTLWWRA